MNFLPIILMLLFAGAAILVVAYVIYIFYNIWYTKKNGIEAEAVISREEEIITYDSDGTANKSSSFVVRYTRTDGEASGQEVEAELEVPGFGSGLKVGERVKIKYLPEKSAKVLLVK